VVVPLLFCISKKSDTSFGESQEPPRVFIAGTPYKYTLQGQITFSLDAMARVDVEPQEHFIYLNSHDRRGFEVPNHGASSFKNVLARPLHLDGDFEVGLINIFLPTEVYSVPEMDSDYTIEIGYRCSPGSGLHYELKPIIFKPTKGIKSPLVHNIILSLDEQLISYLTSSQLIKQNLPENSNDSILQYSPMRQKVILNDFTPAGLPPDINCTMLYTFSSKIARLLGFQPGVPIAGGSVADFYPEYISSINSLNIYCSAASKSLDGDIEDSIIDILGFGNTYSKVQLPVVYKSVEAKIICEIGIDIRDEERKLVSFVHGGRARAVLHFKKKCLY
jgi:hypothetical protein